MKIEKQVRLIPTLDSDEISCIRETIKILGQVFDQMEKYDCDTFICCDGDYTYDISNLNEVIADLERFTEISEIFS